MKQIAELWTLLKAGVAAFIADDALSRGAAIAFYAMTATVPILYISAVFSGFILGRSAASASVAQEVARILGTDVGSLLKTAIQNTERARTGFWPNLFGTVILILTAGGAFVEVQSALNAIWKAVPPRVTVFRFVRSWIESLVLVLALGFLLLASVVAHAVTAHLGDRVQHLFGIGQWFVSILNVGGSSVLIALLFAAVYKILPNRDLHWSDVLAGALITTALFQAGEYLIGLYLGTMSIGYRYGAAGGVIVVLMWIYYSAQVFLLGAEFTKIWSMRHGSRAARQLARAEHARHPAGQERVSPEALRSRRHR